MDIKEFSMIGEHEDINRDWNGQNPPEEITCDGKPLPKMSQFDDSMQADYINGKGENIFIQKTVTGNLDYFIRLQSDAVPCTTDPYHNGFVNALLWVKSLFDGVSPEYVALDDEARIRYQAVNETIAQLQKEGKLP